MADILGGLLKLIGRSSPQVRVSGDHGPARAYGNLITPWTRAEARRKLEADLCDMDRNDGLVSRILDKVVDHATCFERDDFFGFRVTTANTPGTNATAVQTKAVAIINDLVDRTNLTGQKCWDIVRDMVKKGNVFTEQVYADDKIVAIKEFQASWQIEKNLDNAGNLKSGNPAEVVRDPKKSADAAYVQVNDLGKVVAAFWPFQIDHWGFGPTSGGAYHEPLMASGVRNWKRLQAQLDSIGIARVTRAWDTTVHKIPVPIGASPQEVADRLSEYRESIERDYVTTYDSSSTNFQSTPRYSPMDVARDHYIPSYYNNEGKMAAGDVVKLAPSTAALDNINDIYLAISYLIATLNVPKELVGLELGERAFINKGSEESMEAFSKFIRRLQFSHALGLKQLFDIQLLLSGVDPRGELYKVIYPGISPQTAESEAKIIMTRGQAATYWRQMGVPPELIGPMIGFDVDAIKQWRTELEKNIAAQKDIEAALTKKGK